MAGAVRIGVAVQIKIGDGVEHALGPLCGGGIIQIHQPLIFRLGEEWKSLFKLLAIEQNKPSIPQASNQSERLCSLFKKRHFTRLRLQH